MWGRPSARRSLRLGLLGLRAAGVAAVAAGALACSGASDFEGVGAAASSDATGPVAAQMNDVSVLFPLPTSAADVDDLLSPSATGARGVLFPSALYSAIGMIAGATSNEATPGSPAPPADDAAVAGYDDLRVVAMRVDPCFVSSNPGQLGKGCSAQLRLVIQEVLWQDRARVWDSAVHVTYALSRSEVLALSQALVALRAANQDGDALGPLAPHPIMARQGLAGAMSAGVQQLILAYAGERNIIRVARSGIAVSSDPGALWDMAAFDVSGDATAPRAIATLVGPDGGSAFSQRIVSWGPGPDSRLFAPSPSTTANADFTALGGLMPTSLSASDRQAALDALVRVENPRDFTMDTLDCASCHMATGVESNVALPDFAFDDTASPLSFAPDGTSVTHGDMKASYPTDESNIHAFGYLSNSYTPTSPAISQRVVNETAAVVEYLNDLSSP